MTAPATHHDDEYDDQDPEEREFEKFVDDLWYTRCPERFYPADLEDLDQPKQIQEDLEEWVAGTMCHGYREGNLLLLGPVGSGKSWAAHAVAHSGLFYAVATMPRSDVRCTSAIKMLDSLRPGGEKNLTDYTAPKLLLLDDLGTERPTEWTDEQLFAVIDARWTARKPTIVTSNLTADQLKQHLGARIADRLFDQALVIVLKGPSRRHSPTTSRTGA